MTTYRAAYWVSADGQSDVVLTTEDQANLSDIALTEAALAEAAATGLEIGEGRICVGEYTL